jgi:hypothetical protein
MALSAPLIASVKAAAAVMSDARDPWWVIASAAVALHGADPGHVADVDVLLSTADATRLLPALGLQVRRGAAHPDFRSSVFATWTDGPLPVEFMARFAYRAGTDWLPVQPKTREPVQVDRATLFVPSRAELRQLLHAFGRPKDIERANHLAELG